MKTIGKVKTSKYNLGEIETMKQELFGAFKSSLINAEERYLHAIIAAHIRTIGKKYIATSLEDIQVKVKITKTKKLKIHLLKYEIKMPPMSKLKLYEKIINEQWNEAVEEVRRWKK